MKETGVLLARLLRLITMIQGDRRWRPASIAGHLCVSERTVFRDLQRLEAGGVPVQFDKESGGYFIRRGFFLPPVDLSTEEVCAMLLLADRVAGAEQLPMTRAAASAMEKLKAGLPDALRDLVQEILPSVSFHLAAAEGEGIEDAWSIVSRAIAERRTIHCSYEPAQAVRDSGQHDAFDFDPYHLYFGQRAWYVVGYHHGRGEWRTLRLSRFSGLHPTERHFDPIEPFSLDKHFGHAWRMIPGDRIRRRIALRFDATVADTVAETYWHRTQEVEYHDDGSITVRFEIDGLDEIAYWVLGYGPHCEVLEPMVLRERVAGMLRQAVSYYIDVN